MSPDPRSRARKTRGRTVPKDVKAPVRTRPSPDDAHEVAYFRRHVDDDPQQRIPGRDALQSWPATVRAKLVPTLVAVASAPPKRFAGGGRWEAMHGEMTGYFEVRVDGPRRHHYRLYCLLDYEAAEREKPLLVVLDGRDKPFRTSLDPSDYEAIRAMGDEYRKRSPRSLA